MQLSTIQIPDCQTEGVSYPVTALGNADILQTSKLALFCSVKCPGDLILRTYDLAVELRRAGITVVSGFHTPMEKECLWILLRGTQPVVICPARGIHDLRLAARPNSSGWICSPRADRCSRSIAPTTWHW